VEEALVLVLLPEINPEKLPLVALKLVVKKLVVDAFCIKASLTA